MNLLLSLELDGEEVGPGRESFTSAQHRTEIRDASSTSHQLLTIGAKARMPGPEGRSPTCCETSCSQLQGWGMDAGAGGS